MPKTTIYNEEFGRLIRELFGELSNDKAAAIVGVSPETIRRMRNNRVSDESTINKVIAAFPDSDAQAIKIAAGYAQPKDLIARVEIALRGETKLSDEGKRQVLQFVKDMEAKYGGDADQG